MTPGAGAPPRAVLFDLDGTLIDSRRDLAGAVNSLLVEVGLEPLPERTVLDQVGRGARSLVRRSLDLADPEGRVGREEGLLRRFLGHYLGRLLEATVPYPGVVAGLERLQAAGMPMAVVTNKPEAPARTILDGLDLARFFPVVLGGDSLPTRKPEPEMLQVAAHRLGVPLPRCWMIGDSDVDLDAARRAGVVGVWCSWGGIHPDAPRGAVRHADRFDELVEALLADAQSANAASSLATTAASSSSASR